MNDHFDIPAEVVEHAREHLREVLKGGYPPDPALQVCAGNAVALPGHPERHGPATPPRHEAIPGPLSEAGLAASEGEGPYSLALSRRQAAARFEELGEAGVAGLLRCELPPGFYWLLYFQAGGDVAGGECSAVPIRLDG